MLVSDFLERLSLGPLSNLSLSNEGDGTIVAGKIPAIVNHVNDALLRLFTRFNLSEKELIVETHDATTNYKLHSKYAQSRQDDFPALTPHIIDQFKPFTDDLVRVLAVHGSNGRPYPLNDDGASLSLFTPQVNVLQVPAPWVGVPLFVMYQAKHPKLESTGTGFMSVEIDLPTVLEEAALSYVAHRVFANMSGQEHIAVAAVHLTSYENICSEVQDKDLVSASLSQSNTKFEMRGFV